MNYEITKYNDIEIGQILMTAKLTSQPYKVLFFAERHFLFLRHRTISTFDFAKYTNQTIAKSKEPFICRSNKSKEYKQLIKKN